MIVPRPLTGCIVGISVSESEELRQLGFDRAEMNRCVVRLAESLLAAGARLAFGHDWRPGGVMEAVAALAVRYCQVRRDSKGRPAEEAPIINRVASPDVPYLHQQSINSKHNDPLYPGGIVSPMVRLLEGVVDARQTEASRGMSRADALSLMREELAELCHVRVCLGGRTSGYSGKLPGVIEEALGTLCRGRAVYASSIFGGASCIVAQGLSKGKVWSAVPAIAVKLERETAAIRQFAGKVNSGLDHEEEFRLWRSRSIEEIIELTLRGAVRVWTAK